MTPDETRLDDLARRCGPPVLAYLARRCEPVDEAADIYQQVLVTTWQKIATVPSDPEAALCWMLAVARRHLANHTRGHRRRLLTTQAVAQAITVGQPVGVDPDLSDALAALSPDDRELLRLVYWDGLTLAQAGQVLGISDGTARKRAQRARDQLRTSTASRTACI